jgi:Glyoxalase-like domain
MGEVRLRQLAVAALDAGEVVEQLCAVLGLSTSYQDPGVAEFGLENHVFALGNQFLELVSPVTHAAPVWRFLQKRGRDAAGYMVVLEVDSVDPYRARAETLRLRVVLDSESETWGTLHLHPRDMGSLMSVDRDKGGDWTPAGPDWQNQPAASAIAGIAGVRIATSDPIALASRWATFLDIPHSSGVELRLNQGTIEFVPAASGCDGLAGVDVFTSEETRVGECHTIAGTDFQIVKMSP